MPRTWLLSGIPRSGTSLSCRLAGDLPDTVALSEPFNDKLKELRHDPSGACARIRDLVRKAREQILTERWAPSVHVGGRLYDNIVALKPEDRGLRRNYGEWGRIKIEKPLSARFSLVIRDNSVFAALIPELKVHFSCLAIVRNPLSILASWQTVNLPVQRGHVPGAEMFDRDLRRALEQQPELLRRQTFAIDWFFARFRTHLAAENVIRYEDLVDSGGRALFRRLGHASAEPVALTSRNASALYDAATIDALLSALLETRGFWTHFYSPADCERVAARIRCGR